MTKRADLLLALLAALSPFLGCTPTLVLGEGETGPEDKPTSGAGGSAGGGAGGGAGAAQPDGGDGGPTKVTCHGPPSISSTPTALALPPALHGIPFPFQQCPSFERNFYHLVPDLTGDGRADLLVYGLCADPSVGRTRWLVYPGTATGFGPTALSFALPTIAPEQIGSGGFPILAMNGGERGGGACSQAPGETERYSYTMEDMTRDGRRDLVVTKMCGDASVGTTRWLVYENLGTGFATTPATYTLPTDYAVGTTSVTLCRPGVSQDGPVTSHLDDVDGDGYADSSISRKCDDETVGTTRWIVHRGAASGFGPAQDVALPAYDVPLHLGQSETCPGGAVHRQPLFSDVDGDRKPDLWLASHCEDADVNVTKWAAFRGQGSALSSTLTTFPLPTAAEAAPLWPPLHGASGFIAGCETGRWFAQKDPNGRVELRHAVSCTTWDYYRAAPSGGFAMTPETLTFSNACAEGSSRVRADVDGDGLVDEVLSTCPGTNVGQSEWRLYRGVCPE